MIAFVGKKHRTLARKEAVEQRDAVLPPFFYPSSYMVPSSIPSAVSYSLTVIEAAGVSAVRRCVTLIANAIAGQKWTEWEGRGRIDPPTRIVEKPSAGMTRREWVWRVISQMALEEVAYLHMVGGVDDEGVPGSLIPLPSAAIAPAGYSDPFGIFPPTAYTISGIPGTVSGESVIAMRSAFWPGVPIHLQGILRMARNTLMQAWASDSYGAKYWQAGGSPVTVLTTDQELTDMQAERYANRWKDRRSKGPEYPAVMGSGVSASPWGADVSNTVAVEARREVVVEIANLFGVPARYLNVVPTGTSMTYSNLNDEALSLERFTLAGFVDPIQDVVSGLLPEGREMVIDMTPLTRASQEARFRAWSIATGNKAWMLPHEVRLLENMPPSEEIEAFEEVGLQAAEKGVETMNEAPSEKEPVNA